MGTPDFAAACLRAVLDAGEQVVAVVTGEDRQRGRGMHTVPTPVKALAEERGLRVFQPSTLRGEDFAELLAFLDPDLILVAAYGKILPENVLEYPKYGCINAHASLLPKYRGAAPIQRAVMNGERETGVTAMYMDEGLDTGDMILSERVAIEDDDTFETVHDKLAQAGAEAISRVVKTAKTGELPREKQNGNESTYAAKIERADRVIDFNESACAVHNKIRGLYPFPRAFTTTPCGATLQITSARVADAAEGVPGEVVSVCKDGFTVKCSDGCVTVTGVIPEGKGKMSAADFVRGRKIAVGDVLGAAPVNGNDE